MARKGPVSIPELAATFADDLARARVPSPKPAPEPAAVSVPQPSPWPDLEDDEEPPTTVRPMPDEDEDVLFPPLETFGITEGADAVGRVPLYSDIRELAPRQEAVVPSDAVELASPADTHRLTPRHAAAELVSRIREADPPWLPWAAAAVVVLAVAQAVTWWSVIAVGSAPSTTASVTTQERSETLADVRTYTKPARAMKMGAVEERPPEGGASTVAGAQAPTETPSAVPSREQASSTPTAWPRGGADDGARMRSPNGVLRSSAARTTTGGLDDPRRARGARYSSGATADPDRHDARARTPPHGRTTGPAEPQRRRRPALNPRKRRKPTTRLASGAT